MKKTIILLLVVLLNLSTTAQSLIIQVKEADQEGWKYVTIDDKQLGDKIYKKGYPFSEEGLAIIVDEKKTYFINTKGDEIIPEIQNFTMFKPKGLFGGIIQFQSGMLPVKRSERWGYLDVTGKLKIPLKYDKATPFDKGFAVVMKDEKYFIINTKGDETPIILEKVIKIQHLSDGLAPYYTKDKKWGFVGTDGKATIPAQYKAVGYFKNGIAWARNKKGKFGFIDKKGTWVLEPIYDTAKDFDKLSGMARVKLKGKWGYVNLKGEFLEVETDKWGDFHNGLAKGKKGNLIGFYDNTGSWVIEASLLGSRQFSNGYCAAKKDEKWGLINKKGEWVIEPKYAGIRDVHRIGK
ncbi:MAG: WG repeat-containing protein [Bacteroidales bacterium]|nr:WG repeat-containing protein [Bacteroidales bacterium]